MPVEIVSPNPTSLDDIYKTQFGFKSWNFPPGGVIGSTAPTAGTIYALAVPLRAGLSVTKVRLQTGTAGSGTVPTSITVALATATAVVGLSAELKSDAGWTTATAIREFSLSTFTGSGSSYTAPADGVYYVLFLQVGSWGTTQMTLRNGTESADAGSSLHSATAGTAQSALPAIDGAITLSNTNHLYYFAGVA